MAWSTRVTDVDNGVSSLTTYDVFGRPVLSRAAENKDEETQTATEYSDVNRRVIVRADLNTVGDGKLVTIQHYDQLGRIRLTRQLEDVSQSATDETAGVKVQTRYAFVNPCAPNNEPSCVSSNQANLASYQLVSNPYRTAYSSSSGAEISMGWTRTKSDNGGRLIEAETFGGTALPAPFATSNPNQTPSGKVTTAYDAEFTTVTDQSNKKRRSRTDGLGQVERVDEPDKNSGALDDGNGNPLQSTSYIYDALGNLRKVTQGAQERFFMYDSLSRLIRTSNPEQVDKSSLNILDPVTGRQTWSLKYVYDDNGNLTQKTDARGIVSTVTYDALNRPLTRSYSDGTPTVTYGYDAGGVANSKGRLTSVSSSVSSFSYTEYDSLGRLENGAQTIGAQTYTLGYTYDRASHIKSTQYPSGESVNNSYDLAGRINSVTGNLGGETQQRNYITGITYDAASRTTQEQLGTTTALFNKSFYNSRGQLAEIRVGTAPNNTDWERGAIINHYSNGYGCWGASCNAPDNNGNLAKQEIHIPGHTMRWQQYGYDYLNRLIWTREIINSAEVWKQGYEVRSLRQPSDRSGDHLGRRHP